MRLDDPCIVVGRRQRQEQARRFLARTHTACVHRKLRTDYNTVSG